MLIWLFQKLTGSAFAKNTITLISGTVLAQAISFIFLLIMQRWFYEPEDFGELSFFLSFSAIFIAMSTLKLEYAIVICEEDESAFHLLLVCAACVVFASLLSIPILLWIVPLAVNIQSLRYFSIAIPLIILSAGLYEILIFWNNRTTNFKRISLSRILLSLSTESSRLALSQIQPKDMMLILGRILGQSLTTLYLIFPLVGSLKRYSKLSGSKAASLLKKYKDFPLFTMPTIMINNLTTWVFVYLFITTYGNQVMGLVSVSIQYIAIPFTIVSGAFSQVFYKKIAEIESKKTMMSLYKNFSILLSAISIGGIAIILLIPEDLVLFVLGEKWKGVIGFMKITVLWQSCAFIPSSLSFIYTRLMKQKIMTLFALTQLLLVYLTLYLGNLFYTDPYLTFKFYVIGQCFYYMLTALAAVFFIRSSTLLT